MIRNFLGRHNTKLVDAGQEGVKSIVHYTYTGVHHSSKSLLGVGHRE